MINSQKKEVTAVKYPSESTHTVITQMITICSERDRKGDGFDLDGAKFIRDAVAKRSL